MIEKKTLLWDWNGTLLDDVDIAVDSINVLLENYKLPQISKNYHKAVFTFPVKQYYKTLGFDFKKINFSQLAKEFHGEYLPRLKNCPLYSQVQSVLNQFQTLGFSQHIVSAMEHERLIKSVQNLGIFSMFDSINGLEDIFAVSKTELAKKVIVTNKIDVKSAWFIGDTIHDFEVAQSIHCHHLMVSNGHHTHKKLLSVTSNVIQNLSEIVELVG